MCGFQVCPMVIRATLLMPKILKKKIKPTRSTIKKIQHNISLNKKTKFMTKLKLNYIIALAALLFTLNSCEAIGAIFKAGVWVGIIIIVIILIIIFWLIRK